MNVYILTLFPEVFDSVFTKSIVKRAQDKKLVKIKIINIRDFAQGARKQVDDKPYGGGEGMVLMAEPTIKALNSIKPKPYTVLLSASGKKYTQQTAASYSKKKNLALICGHYEGVDARVEEFVNDVLSTGDFVLTGGEIPAMAIVDSVVRLLPGSINPNSPTDESYSEGLLEYPQYTRPEVFRKLRVPKILLGGNHKEIKSWRKEQALKRTKKYRKDLLTS